jgi:tetratricopeptide (TPR) repeat protein
VNQLNKIANVYYQMGKNQQFMAVLSEAVDITKTIEKVDEQAHSLTDIAGTYAQAKQHNQAMQLTNIVDNVDTKFEVLMKIAIQSLEVKELQNFMQVLSQALEISLETKDVSSKSRKIAQIAGLYANAKQYDRAIQLVENIQTIDNDSPKAEALIVIANNYNTDGQKDKALNILSQAFEVAKATKCSFWKFWYR